MKKKRDKNGSHISEGYTDYDPVQMDIGNGTVENISPAYLDSACLWIGEGNKRKADQYRKTMSVPLIDVYNLYMRQFIGEIWKGVSRSEGGRNSKRLPDLALIDQAKTILGKHSNDKFLTRQRAFEILRVHKHPASLSWVKKHFATITKLT